MRKIMLILMALLAMGTVCKAQVVLDASQIANATNVHLLGKVEDSKTNEALSNVTAYLIPNGDTTISYFTISNEKGVFEMKDVVPGYYEVNIELIGYKAFKKTMEIRGWRKELGVIKLEEDPEYIDAASITAIGNPIVIKKDTVEYNAAAFRVGENSMLSDLLKRMPGMEVSDDGTVKVNGEKVDKITVGGKTFFFNDPTMAVKNLPAKIVDKIRVIDKTKDEAQFKGITNKSDKEKVMDVQLREEYKKGWFGNIKAGGGTTLSDKSKRGENGVPSLLYNANGLVAGYNEENQLTIIANGSNASIPIGDKMSYIIYGNEIASANMPDELATKNGLGNRIQTGINLNTSKIKGWETTVSAKYNYADKDARETTARTSSVGESELKTNGEFIGKGISKVVGGGIEVSNKDKHRFNVMLNSDFNFANQNNDLRSASKTTEQDLVKNNASSNILSATKKFSSKSYLDFGIKDMGKKKRNLTFGLGYNMADASRNSSERTYTDYGAFSDSRNILNHLTQKTGIGTLSATYSEPISKNWIIQFEGGYRTKSDINNKVTYNQEDMSLNENLSASGKNNVQIFSEALILGYEKDNYSFQCGIESFQHENVINSTSYGYNISTGKGKWYMDYAPQMQIHRQGEHSNLYIDYWGTVNRPTGIQIVPTLDISNPVQMTIGNIYLLPPFTHSVALDYSLDFPEKQISFLSWLYTDISNRGIVYASWFDNDGNRYALPVNSRKTGKNLTYSANIHFPVNKAKTLLLNLSFETNYSDNFGFQSERILGSIDKQNFEYSEVISRLWGDNENGSRFYSGESGFKESRTSTFVNSYSSKISYLGNRLATSFMAKAKNYKSKYSLDSRADRNAWTFLLSSYINYDLGKSWNVQTSADYNFFKGYSDGYGKPYLIWNLMINKNIKSFSIYAGVSDILNQERSLQRSMSEEYVQDTYTNVMGRYILFGISFNFGKMNAKNNDRARNAMYRMMF